MVASALSKKIIIGKLAWYDKPSSHCPCVTIVVVPVGHRVQTWRHRGCIPGQCKLEALTLNWYHSHQYLSGVILPGLPDHGGFFKDHEAFMVMRLMSLWTYRARSSNAEKILHELNMLCLVCMLPTTFLQVVSMHLHVRVKVITWYTLACAPRAFSKSC